MAAPDPVSSIEAHGLQRRFGTGAAAVEAVRGVDLAVARGEVFGMLGPNGAGKTTMLRMLTGQLRPTAGRAVVAGCDVVADRRALHRRIGVVFDAPNMYDQLTGRDNLRFFADLYRADRARVDRLLALTEMEEAAGRRFKTYSKGMKQRLLLARALLPRPAVLFLDEPTSGLDPASSRRVREIVRASRAEGTTIFLTTHGMELADAICDRLAIVDRGRVVAEGTPIALKRAHGKALIRIRRQSGAISEHPLEGAGTPLEVEAALRSGEVAEIATAEPSLEDVFLKLTGRKLT